MTLALLIQSLEARMRSALDLLGELPELGVARHDVVSGFEILVENYEALISTVAKYEGGRGNEVFVPYSTVLADSPYDDQHSWTQRGVVEAAFARASGISRSKKRGHNLALICQDFLSCNGFMSNSRDLEVLLKKYAQLLGISSMIVLDANGRPVLGGDLLSSLIDAAVQVHCGSHRCHRDVSPSEIL